MYHYAQLNPWAMGSFVYMHSYFRSSYLSNIGMAEPQRENQNGRAQDD
jgi:hypothetical protein